MDELSVPAEAWTTLWETLHPHPHLLVKAPLGYWHSDQHFLLPRAPHSSSKAISIPPRNASAEGGGRGWQAPFSLGGDNRDISESREDEVVEMGGHGFEAGASNCH